ncbi:hypothetical protein BTN50_0131 [Candidatus Enterovibrio altilux]|uniref:Uncharacterized protein n=1 Tax=Candidatus Enterovibrio altilux TaxID=1927128 RepID=A0A291B6N6_9GAMM|nr:hypothetical protein BTN50_0131 [Candidatus Enterovibrio luxaltus]
MFPTQDNVTKQYVLNELFRNIVLCSSINTFAEVSKDYLTHMSD